MIPRIFDPHLFKGQGALVDLLPILNAHLEASGGDAIDPFDFGSQFRSIFLRWQVNPEIGMPSEPFKVWRRMATPLGDHFKHQGTVVALPPIGHVLNFDEPVVSIAGGVQAGPSPQKIILMPIADGVGFDSVLGVLSYDLAANQQRSFTFQAPYITGVIMIGTSELLALNVIPLGEADVIGDWELVETVGLPVDPGQWSDLAGQSHGVEQGLVGAEMPAIDAATDRFTRGINPFGWLPNFPTGEQAPQWALPSAVNLAADANDMVLPLLQQAMALPPEDQAAFAESFTISPPENADGKTLDAEDGTAVISPLVLLQMAISSDPLQAVALGFGTGYRYEDIPTLNFGATSLFGDSNVSDWDYMVTGLWHAGLDGDSEPREYAAFIPRPRRAIAPPAPADIQLNFLAHHQPAQTDAPWLASTRVNWERFPMDNLVRSASFAFGRHDPAIPGPAAALMEQRPHGVGHMPIGEAQNDDDPESVRQSATDGGFAIPNDPGTSNVKYGVARQDIFGLLSPWGTVPFNTQQPAPDPVQIVDANLRPTDTGAGTVCPADLVMDIVVDWRVRSVQQVDIGGRLFQAASRDQDPPVGLLSVLQKTLGAPGVPTSLTFAGDVPTLAGGMVQALNDQGTEVVTPGPAQGTSRRYRLTIPGFSLNYAGTPHFGLALYARLRERIAPQRASKWSGPKTTYASDPRSRPTTIVEIVPLASLPDASGRCHAKLDWQDLPSAQGYMVYESNEATILEARGLQQPAPGASLSDRLAALKAAFNGDQVRNAFTRVTEELISQSTYNVRLPLGSQVIHCWAIIPVSHGGVEAPWPSGAAAADDLFYYAAPKLAEPAPPRIEVLRVPDGSGFGARVRVETRAASGARPKQIDLYRTRVADAARRLDSMGLPIATLSATSGPWTVAEDGIDTDEDEVWDETWINTVTGTDTPAGSWNYTWYRAVAWGGDIPTRGVRKGRGEPSQAVPVLIPPEDPPMLSPLVPSWPGGGLGNVLLSFTSASPIPATPIGDHTISVEVTQPGGTAPLVPTSMPLSEVPDAQPPSGSGLWRLPNSNEYRLIVRRPDENVPASVTVRITDPLNRTGEQNHRIEAGSILPPPLISPVDSFAISGRGTFYTVSIDNTSDAEISGAFYRLRIVLTPELQLSGGARDFQIFQPRGAFEFRPRPGPILDFGVLRPQSLFQSEGRRLVFDRAMKDIPTSPNSEVYTVSRQQQGDRVLVTVIATRNDLDRIEFEVTGPDGQTAESSALG